MTKLSFKLAALVAAAFAMGGCASKPAAADVAPPPVSGFPMKVIESTQVTASVRYVRMDGPLPEAKGPLAFLADEAGLKNGTITLTQTQADAALADLTRVTGKDVRSTPAVTAMSGEKAGIHIANYDHNGVTINGQKVTHQLIVNLEVSPCATEGGMLQMKTEMTVISFEGTVEAAEPLETVQIGDKSMKISSQPIFSVHKVKTDTRMAVDGELVLFADRKRGSEPVKTLTQGRPEVMLVFLTAKILPRSP